MVTAVLTNRDSDSIRVQLRLAAFVWQTSMRVILQVTGIVRLPFLVFWISAYVPAYQSARSRGSALQPALMPSGTTARHSG